MKTVRKDEEMAMKSQEIPATPPGHNGGALDRAIDATAGTHQYIDSTSSSGR